MGYTFNKKASTPISEAMSVRGNQRYLYDRLSLPLLQPR
jgi:hypothetical protein